jgi:hypothetical protein
MLRFLAIGLIVSSLLFGSASAALAANPHGGGSTGQPNVECEDFVGATPGHSASAGGSAFNGDGTGHDAYEAAGAPSQYDVACFQQAQHQ